MRSELLRANSSKQIEDNKELMKIESEILLSIHEFCVENDLKYYLWGGDVAWRYPTWWVYTMG